MPTPNIRSEGTRVGAEVNLTYLWYIKQLIAKMIAIPAIAHPAMIPIVAPARDN